MIEETDIITGEKLQALADICVVTRSKYQFHKNITKFSDNIIVLPSKNLSTPTGFNPKELDRFHHKKIIYVCPYMLTFFLDHIYPKLKHTFILITHNSDKPIESSPSEGSKIMVWYGQNINIIHPKIFSIPIGIANSQWPHGHLPTIKKVMDKNTPKTNLFYFNFQIKTNSKKRQPIHDILVKNFEYIPDKPWEQYLECLASYKFCASPPGNGIDCHRTWEALYLGVIPVVEKSINTSFYRDLPILEIDDWYVVTPEYLENKYRELQNRSYNYSKLKMGYWKNIINDESFD